MGSLEEWLQRRGILRPSDDIIQEPIPVRLIEATDSSAGGQQIVNTSGQITEVSGASILAGVNATHNVTRYLNAATLFGTAPSGAGASTDEAQHRWIDCTLTATAGGEITSAAIVPALSGFKTCALIFGLWSDQTDGSIAMAINTGSGVDIGPATWTWATTANAVTDYQPGVYYHGSTANEALNASCAAGQAGASQVIQVLGIHWYEA